MSGATASVAAAVALSGAGDPLGHKGYESIMRNCSEEIGDVRIDDPSPAVLQLVLAPAATA